MSGRMENLRVVLEQIVTRVGEVEENGRLIAERLEAAADADLVVFPELALTGYSLGGLVPEMAVALPRGAPPAFPAPEGAPDHVVGLVEEAPDRRLFNAAALWRGSELEAVHRKIYLPTYGMFEEGRRFAAGRAGPMPTEVARGWRIGLLVCEDLWHPSLAYLHALRGADALVVISSAPGRGEPDPTGELDTDGDLFASHERWTLLARTTAFLHGVYVVLCNRAGVEGGVTFAGGSLVAGPDGTIVARAPQGEAARLEVVLEPGAVTRARRPFSHLRDEDPAFLLRELERIVGTPRPGTEGSGMTGDSGS